MLAGFVASLYLEPFEWVAEFDRARPQWHSDDAATGLIFGSISLIWFAGRRMRETMVGASLAAEAIKLERFQALERQNRALEAVADELAHARDDAHAADRLKSQFLVNMSHEFRTPLNAVIGLSDIMVRASRDQLSEVYNGYAADILMSGQRLLSLVNDLFELSMIQAGRSVPYREALNLSALLRTCIELVSSQARMRGLEVALEVPRTLSAMADKGMLTRLVANLLLNAIKFSPHGGRIELRAKPDVEDASWVELVVADGGIGMTAQEVEIALLPFRQVDGGLSRRREGAGLGLPLAKSAAELHGGSLVIDSIPEHGTTVRVRLPILTPAAVMA
ncbi:MAG: HAMP domain-containing sensor histidine kinase [Aliidongia sp.]